MALIDVVVAYDVSDDDDRARVSAYLQRSGVRVQRSVFRCQIPGESLEEFTTELEERIDVERDVVQIFRQCTTCTDGHVALGQAPVDLDVRYWIV